MKGRRGTWLAVVLIGCGFGGCAKTGDGAGPVSRDQLSSRIAAIFCQSLGDCCQSAGFAFSSSQCNGAITATYDKALEGSSSPNVSYDAQAAGDCLAAFDDALLCGRAIGSSNSASCRATLQGKLKAGQACTASQECERPVDGSAYCSGGSAADGSPKVCVTETAGGRGKAGEACVGSCSADVCFYGSSSGTPAKVCYRNDGLYCGASGVCTAIAVRGQPCTQNDGCEAGSFCGTASVCSALLAVGATCNSNNECESDDCDDVTDVCLGRVTAARCATPTLN